MSLQNASEICKKNIWELVEAPDPDSNIRRPDYYVRIMGKVFVRFVCNNKTDDDYACHFYDPFLDLWMIKKFVAIADELGEEHKS